MSVNILGGVLAHQASDNNNTVLNTCNALELVTLVI